MKKNNIFGLIILTLVALVAIMFIPYGNKDNVESVAEAAENNVVETIQEEVVETPVVELDTTEEVIEAAEEPEIVEEIIEAAEEENIRHNKIYDIKMPSEHQWYLYDICKEYNVEFTLAMSIIANKTNYNSDYRYRSEYTNKLYTGYFALDCYTYPVYNTYSNLYTGVKLIAEAKELAKQTKGETPEIFTIASIFEKGLDAHIKDTNQLAFSVFAMDVEEYYYETLPNLLLIEDIE